LQRRCTIRIIAEPLAMNPALRIISSRSFLGLFSLFGLLCSLAVFADRAAVILQCIFYC
jgi:hypothetical protein